MKMIEKNTPHLKSYLPHLGAALILLLTAGLCFGIFDSPRIFSDDWCQFAAFRVFNIQPLINWADHRPLMVPLFAFFTSTFGLNLTLFYWMNAAVLFLCSVLVYGLMLRLLPKMTWLAFPVSLIYLIYPVDYSRTWLTMFPVIHTTLLCLLLIFLLMIDYLRYGGAWRYLLIVLGVALPLLAYEGQAGLAMLLPCLLFFYESKTPLRRRVLLLALLAIGVIFVVWRFLIQPRYFNINDVYVDKLVWTPELILNRFWAGVLVFSSGWVEVISPYLGISPLRFILLLGGLTLLCGAVGWGVGKTIGKSAQPLPWQAKQNTLRTLLLLLVTGVAVWVAGYLPIILLSDPKLTIISSRVNAYAILGAALLLTALFAALAVLLSTSLTQARLMTFALILPFVLAGVFAQYCVQLESQRNWQEQRYIWKELFELLPGIKDNTLVTIVVPAAKNIKPLYRPPLSYQWETNCGVKSLYNTNQITGAVYNWGSFVPNPSLQESGLSATPYQRTIFVYIDPFKQNAHIIDNLKEEMRLPFEVQGYAPRQNILPEVSPRSQAYRWLVK